MNRQPWHAAIALALLWGGCSYDLNARLRPEARPAAAEAGSDAPRVDGRPTDAPTSDAGNDGADGSIVDPLTPFGPAKPVSELNTSSVSEDDPSLPRDMLEIFFERNDDIWRATRASVGDAFSAPKPVRELNTSDEEGEVDISADGLTIFISRAISSNFQVMVATRKSRTAAFSTPVLVSELNDSRAQLVSGLTPDLRHLGLAISSGQADLYIASRTSATARFSAPRPLSALNTALDERSIWIDASRTLIYFARERTRNGHHDLWFAQRASPTVPFSAPHEVTSLNTSAREDDPWLSPDRRTMYFVRQTSGQRDIWVAHR